MPVKYRIEFSSRKYAIPYRLDIHDATFVGTPVSLSGANPPVVMRKDSDGIFSGTSLDIGIEVPASMPWGITDLYSQSARDHKVELFKSNILIWSGYLVPEEYSDPLVSPPFDIFLRAVDGIGTLKDFTFDIAPTAALMTQTAIIRHCLTNLSLGLPIAINMRIWEDAHSTTYSALDQTLMSPAAFYDDGKALTCDKVIARILSSYDPDITLTQHAGHWMITRDIDAPANSYVVYGTDGNSTATAANLTTTIDLDSIDNYTPARCFPIGSMTRTFHPQLKKLTVEQGYGLNSNILPLQNNDDDFAFNEMYGWISNYFNYIEYDGIDFPPCRRIITKDGNYASHAVSTWAGVYNISSFRMSYVVPQSGVSLALLLNVASMHASRVENTNVIVQIRIAVSVSLIYYLSDAGWTTTEASLTLSIPTQLVNTSEATLTELSIIAPPVPAQGHLMLSISPKIPYGQNLNAYPIGFILGTTTLRYIRENGENPFESSLTADVLINSNAIKSDNVDVFGDAPEAISVASDVWHNVFLLPTHAPTALWRMSGDTASDGLLSVASRSIASNNRAARQVYNGTLMGQAITPNSIIRHPGNNNSLFRIISASHNLLEDELNGDMRELLPFVEPDVELITSPIYTDTKKTVNTLNGSNDYTIFGGNVGVGRRAYQLSQATDTTGTFIILDKEGNTEAQKYPYIEGFPKSLFDQLFELIPNSGNPYIMAKMPFASVGEVSAYASGGLVIPSLWDALPTASATVKGGIKIGSGLSIDANGIVSVTSQGTIQTLSLNGTTLSISGGNSVTIPATYTDVMARAACAVSGTVYDSARLAGVAASYYTRRDVNEAITGVWQFPSFTQIGANTSESYLKYKTDSREWWTGLGMHNSGDDFYGIYDATAAKIRMSIDLDGKFGFNKAPGSANVEIKGNVGIGQFTNGTAVIDAYNTNAYFGCNTATNGITINSAGAVLGSNNITAKQLGITETSLDGYGISLYDGLNNPVLQSGKYFPNFGLFFGLTNLFGTHGYTTGDVATYFTLDGTANRGWIFKANTTNVFSISNAGNVYTNGSFNAANDVVAGGKMVSGNGTNGGFTNAVYVAGANRIWSFDNAVDYGIYYNQGGGIDYIYMPFGSHTSPKFKFDVYGNFTAVGEVSAYAASDKRLKTNIKTITNAADILRQQRAVEFDWNETAMRLNPAKRDAPHSVSFIAQEWEKVLPWATHSIFGKYKSIDLNVMTGYLVAGWNEHDKQLTTHDKEINRLRKQVSELEKQLNKP